MKKTTKALRKPVAILILMMSFVACDKDFYEIDSAVLGKDNANFVIDSLFPKIVSYNKKLDAVQINNLPANLLGYFNDPEFGATSASIVAQVSPTSFPTSTRPNVFGDNPVLDSVVLSIPYFSRIANQGSVGFAEYELDSIYGDQEAPIKLSVYQNNYFLRNINPDNLNASQSYFSNANTASTDNLALTNSSQINFDDFRGDLLSETTFKPDSTAVITVVAADTTRSVPAIRIKLDSTFWQNTLISKNGQPELSNANNFNNFFRGLYMKAEAVNANGSLMMLNLASADAKVTLHYTRDIIGGNTGRVQDTYTLNFSGNRLNAFINDFSRTLNNGNQSEGDDKLFLKGMEGSMAVVDLFPTPEDLDNFIDDFRIPNGNNTFLQEETTGDFILNKLINEAYLLVYEDETSTITPVDTTYHRFDRIYAYDIKNNIPTIDYLIDPSENSGQPFFSKVLHLGQRLKDNNGSYKYKIRLTEHLNNILQKDSTNTKIGLVLSSNVNIVRNSEILNSTDDITQVPSVSVITPRGTILHGSNSSATEKRMVLKLFTTEPEQVNP
ncbi:DUF4270 domain-containing protein [Seonamhaeicola sp. ML3]|uniref:DUF4270 domain-containing protein n=1 Tax=Seonamhaeicola sp. ML3 TaxID=2937786 RepID=UPI00200D51D9|nr:DUF4270 domain-containing protein [Seonamhaeicola sp. ML3]